MLTPPILRLCHPGIDRRALHAFEIFLARIGPASCRIADEGVADVAFIDADTDLGPYLLRGHRLLYPSRPLIVTARTPGRHTDPLTIEVAKPLGLAAFAAALEQVRRLLPPPGAGQAEAADGSETAPATISVAPAAAALQAPPARRSATARPGGSAAAARRGRMEERLATLHVGSRPDVDLDEPSTHATLFYAPEHFLQGMVARALAHAREIGRPVRIDAASGPALFLDPGRGLAYPAGSANALRALAQLPTRGTVSMVGIPASDAQPPSGLTSRPLEALEWDLALWASRGRLPHGTRIELPVRLRGWPNLTRRAVPPEALRIAGLWSRDCISLPDTVRLLDIPQRYVFAFYSACHALGLVEQVAPAPEATPGAALAASTPPPRGRFPRLLGKLLGVRPETPGAR